MHADIKNETFTWEPQDDKTVELMPLYRKAEKIITSSSDMLSTKASFADALSVTCRLHIEKQAESPHAGSSTHIENNMVFQIDESIRENTQKTPHDTEQRVGKYAVEILLYPLDILFLPSSWEASLSPLFEGMGNSKASEMEHEGVTHRKPVSPSICRKRVLLSSLTAYMNPIKRTGHFATAEKLTLFADTEEEFLRKNVRKQVRWDEIQEGQRRVF